MIPELIRSSSYFQATTGLLYGILRGARLFNFKERENGQLFVDIEVPTASNLSPAGAVTYKQVPVSGGVALALGIGIDDAIQESRSKVTSDIIGWMGIEPKYAVIELDGAPYILGVIYEAR